ncbi:MAG TPA: type II toxin-antitoxin system HicA family toxin [Candidatus Kapabacteria bacterium]|nr:type II toxin-antitoxin system HicA family toxin [Candidatus Kapabacteria bacterium]
MRKLRVLSGEEVCSILSRHGFERMRQTGSHIVMRNPSEARTVPVPNHKELDRGTLGGIIRQSGLDRMLFEA